MCVGERPRRCLPALTKRTGERGAAAVLFGSCQVARTFEVGHPVLSNEEQPRNGYFLHRAQS